MKTAERAIPQPSAWIDGERRFSYDWRILGVDPQLMEFATAEAATWDDWANQEMRRIAGQSVRLKPPGLWETRYPSIGKALKSVDLGSYIAGKRILDIGGTGKDLPYLLSYGPERIDHVEVSALSQKICLEKIRSLDAAESTAFVDRVWFHTIPAEHLPFEDDTFDFIISRSTIHHCQRPKVIEEVARVSKPGGLAVFIEPYMSDPVYMAMKTYRRLRRVDRGSDDPLRARELKHAKRYFSRFDWVIAGADVPFRYFVRKDDNPPDIVSPGVFGKAFGTRFVSVGIK